MSDLIVAKRYTRALFELAAKSGDLAAIEDILKSLKDLTVSHPKFLRLIANPTLTEDEKYRLVRNLLPQDAPDLLDRFLKVLLAKKRFALLPDIQILFHASFEKKQGIQEVEMISAAPLSSDFLGKLKAVLTRKLRASSLTTGSAETRTEIRLIPKTDKALLGGFVLRFNEKEIDCSFKTRIHEIRQKLFGSPEEGTANA